jgi:hypothetical protein
VVDIRPNAGLRPESRDEDVNAADTRAEVIHQVVIEQFEQEPVTIKRAGIEPQKICLAS